MFNPNDAEALQALSTWYDTMPAEAVFSNHRTGNQVLATVKPHLMAISKNLFSRGCYEHMSPTYLAVYIEPWVALYDQTNDRELKAAADAALRYLSTTLASSHLYGQHVGPYRRENVKQRALYETAGATPNLAATQRICWLWWGDNSRSLAGDWDAREIGVNTYIAAASSWRPPAAINRIALGTEPLTSRGSVPYSERSGGYDAAHTAYPDSERRAYTYWRMSQQNWQGDFSARQSPFENTSHHLNTFISLFNIPMNDPWAERGRLDFREFRRSPLIQEGRLRYPATRDKAVEEGEWILIRDGGSTLRSVRSMATP